MEVPAYYLPRPAMDRGADKHLTQWASLVPVTPLAKLPVGPEDFPFLAQIRGHDDKRLFARATADPEGFPWMDEG
jgi:hypothetical protein